MKRQNIPKGLFLFSLGALTFAILSDRKTGRTAIAATNPEDEDNSAETAVLSEQPCAPGAESPYITREEATLILQEELRRAEIPLSSITAKCMFHPTRDSGGNNRCQFGRTPLWDNELQVEDDKVSRPLFMYWVRRLCDSGKKHQHAAWAAGW